MEEAKVTCPYCERKHSMVRKDGKLRQEIHCKCKDWTKHRTLISWVCGAGYHVFDKNMNMIPAISD